MFEKCLELKPGAKGPTEKLDIIRIIQTQEDKEQREREKAIRQHESRELQEQRNRTLRREAEERERLEDQARQEEERLQKEKEEEIWRTVNERKQQEAEEVEEKELAEKQKDDAIGLDEYGPELWGVVAGTGVGLASFVFVDFQGYIKASLGVALGFIFGFVAIGYGVGFWWRKVDERRSNDN